ncbi:Ada metal-binding domain-containing protein [Mucilaginibacter sp.]|uniref:Ada metal-binding domain-containing protein n=1 Tax=Mucilaginibacter sp. TaxID=1882438 RepID=UPI0035BC64D2
MIAHNSLSGSPYLRSKELKILIDQYKITFAGNRKLKIYGMLNCSSGKRMKPLNRVFFKSEREAITMGYRPCGQCMRKQYQKWKSLN